MDTFVPLEEVVKKTWPMHQLREQCVDALRTLDSDKVTWKALWFSKRLALYGYEDKLWVLLVGLWGTVSDAPLLVLRQYGSEQFVPQLMG